jgi:hypothetical protein
MTQIDNLELKYKTTDLVYGTFTFWETVNGIVQKVRVECTLNLAAWLVNNGMINMGVFETPTNRIFL